MASETSKPFKKSELISLPAEHRLAQPRCLAAQPARGGHDERGGQKDQQKHQVARHEAGDGDEHRADELHTGVHAVQKALPRHIFQKLGH